MLNSAAKCADSIVLIVRVATNNKVIYREFVKLFLTGLNASSLPVTLSLPQVWKSGAALAVGRHRGVLSAAPAAGVVVAAGAAEAAVGLRVPDGGGGAKQQEQHVEVDLSRPLFKMNASPHI
jgi:hypothetical protein